MARGTVLLLGATGFIGGRLLAALGEAGYDVVCGVRKGAAFSQRRSIPVDFMRDHDEADWRPRLAGVDFVINTVGILRESDSATFDALHVAAPVALFHAALRAGVKKIVQISALGADEAAVSRYHVTKKRADDALAALDVPWVGDRPAVAGVRRGRGERGGVHTPRCAAPGARARRWLAADPAGSYRRSHRGHSSPARIGRTRSSTDRSRRSARAQPA